MAGRTDLGSSPGSVRFGAAVCYGRRMRFAMTWDDVPDYQPQVKPSGRGMTIERADLERVSAAMPAVLHTDPVQRERQVRAVLRALLPEATIAVL